MTPTVVRVPEHIQPGDVLVQSIPPSPPPRNGRCQQEPWVLRVGAPQYPAPLVVFYEDRLRRAAAVRRRLDESDGLLVMAWPSPVLVGLFGRPQAGLA